MAFAPIVFAITIGIITGLLRRGRLRGIFSAHLNGLALLVIAVACGLAVDQFALPNPGWWAAASLTTGLVFTLLNVHVGGMVVISIGLVANLIPVALNGAIPVRGEALIESGTVTAADLDQIVLNGPHILADEQTVLGILGAVIPVSAIEAVLSFGDLIILIGIASVLANLMRGRRHRAMPASALTSPEVFDWIETAEDAGPVIATRTELLPLHPNDAVEFVRPIAITAPRQTS